MHNCHALTTFSASPEADSRSPGLTGVGLYINKVSNVIVRNMKIAKVSADDGDCIGIQASKNVWVDHVDVSGDLNAGKDDYDGLIDITHACEWVTVSNSYIHDHVSSNTGSRKDCQERTKRVR